MSAVPPPLPPPLPPVPPPLPAAGAPGVPPVRRATSRRVRAPMQNSSRRNVILATLALVLGLGSGATFMVWKFTHRVEQTILRPPVTPDVAQKFLHALTIADGVDPDAPKPGTPGYEHAWSLLDATARDERPLDVFVEEWMRVFDRFGPIVDVSPPQGIRVANGWRAASTVRFGGDRQATGGFTTLVVTLNLVRSREPGSEFRVRSFTSMPAELVTGR